MSRDYQFETKVLLTKNKDEKGAVSPPIYQTNAFEYETAEELENGVGALGTASGMAAIATAVLGLVEAGDEIVAGNSLFGGTYNFFKKDLKQWGIKCSFVETTELEEYRQAINPKTKLIYIETVGNPKLDIPDIKKLAELAHEHGLPLILDNTLMTPYLFLAKDDGVDIVLHSTSKSINGSSNSIGGVIIDTGNFNWAESDNPLLAEYLKFGPFAYLAKLRQDIFRNLGPAASPFNSFLNNLGVETLPLRMEKHCSNALELARNLSNLGDLRTLVVHPESTIYHSLSQAEQQQLGVNPALIRVSVGIESPDDIIRDFKEALTAL